jgi:hypothetical protein
MSDCCLMPNQQCFSHVMARTSYRGTFNNQNNVSEWIDMSTRDCCFSELVLLKSNSACWSSPKRTLSSSSSIISCCVLNGESTNINVIVIGLTQQELGPIIYSTRGEHAIHYTIDTILTNCTCWSSPKRTLSSSSSIISLNVPR